VRGDWAGPEGAGEISHDGGHALSTRPQTPDPHTPRHEHDQMVVTPDTDLVQISVYLYVFS